MWKASPYLPHTHMSSYVGGTFLLKSISCTQTAASFGCIESMDWIVDWIIGLDWITGSTFELNLLISPDLLPIRRVHRSHSTMAYYNVSCNHYGCPT